MAHAHVQDGSSKKIIMKIFWILLVITLVEVFWGVVVSHVLPKWLNAIFFISLTLVKASYIVAEFMHLKHERISFIRAVIIPLFLFVWFIIAFCADGSATLKQKIKYNYLMEPKKAPVEKTHH